MQAPEFAPVQGMPSIAGTSGLPGIEVNPDGEFGTKYGVQTVVKTSISSPGVHAAMGSTGLGCAPATNAIAGAAAIARANPVAANSRVVIVTGWS